MSAFKSKAVCAAVDIGLAASLVLSTLPSPTMALVIPETVPENVGLARFAFRSRAFCVAVDIGFALSLVSSTLLIPTIALVIPETVPVNVGSLSGA